MKPLDLKAREIEILKLMASDLSNKEIAQQLFLAEQTVRWYNSQIYSKLAVKSRQEAVNQARLLGLFQTDESDQVITHNLPAQTTPFIGRKQEIAELSQLFEDEHIRLVTILAAGGMGKTRLALELSEQFVKTRQADFPDGIFYVPLEPLSDSEHIVSQIANSIGFQFMETSREPQEQLLAYLAEKQLLLLTDNWEHLLDGVSLVADILQAAPGIRILSTSREKLKLSGETVYSLKGMNFPTWETPQNALEYDAVRLLLQSARYIKPDWTVTTENLEYVARICRLTEGMPLGIVLAVSWLDALSLKDIADEIQHSVDFLAAELRDMPERQASIRAVFNYAWKRLSRDQQQLLMRLSVFRGGFTWQAARRVAESHARILQSLVNKALVTRDNFSRYGIHELLRQYAEEHLRDSELELQTHRKHAQYFIELAETAEPELRRGRHVEVAHELEAEHDNLRAAMRRSLDSNDPEPAIRIMAALRDFWFYGSNYNEHWHWYEEGRSHLDEVAPLLRVRLLIAAAMIATIRRDFAISRELAEQALEILQELDNKRLVAWAMLTLFWAEAQLFASESIEQKIETLNEILSLLHEVGDEAGIAQGLNMKGHVYFTNKDYSSAYSTYEQCLDISRHTGEKRRIGISLYNMGKVAYLQADHKNALRLIHDAIEQAYSINYRVGIGGFLSMLAGPLCALGEAEQAARFLAAADAYIDRLGVQIQKGGGSDILVEQIRETLRKTLGEDAYEVAYQTGRSISIDEAVAEVLSDIGEP